MDYKELVDALKSMLPEKVLYGDLIGAEGVYAHSGPLVYEDPEPYFIEQAITAITDLLARVEAAEHLLQEVKEQRDYCREKCDVAEKNYQIEMERRKSAEYRARKAEQERDAAVSDLRGVAIESYAECMYCLYRTAKSFCWNCQDGSNWKWSGLKEEQEVTADKDGRCMVLPCNVDDDVYINILGKTLKFLVISVFKIQSTPTFKALHGVKLCYIFKEEDIGKTVFLTRIDAESALAEKGNN